MHRVLLIAWTVVFGLSGIGCHTEILFDSSSDKEVSASLFRLAGKDCPVNITTRGGIRYRLEQVRRNADRSINGVGIRFVDANSLGDGAPVAKHFAGRIPADSILILEQSSSSVAITVRSIGREINYHRWHFTEERGFTGYPSVSTESIRQISRQSIALPLVIIPAALVAFIVYECISTASYKLDFGKW